jgi:Tol biopolymer transport system component
MLMRALRKDAGLRLRDIGDARVVLHDQQTGTFPIAATSPVRRKPSMVWTGVALSAGILLGAGFMMLQRPPTMGTAAPTLNAQIPLPEGTELSYWDTTPIALSADGSNLVFTVEHPDRSTELFLRPIDGDAAQPIPGTRGGNDPFFSPDGRWIAYFDYPGKRLMKVPVEGGAPMAVCSAQDYSRGGAWSRSGTMIFPIAYTSGLYRVSADGGEAIPLTAPTEEEKSHRYPYVLPDDDTVLFVSIDADLTDYDDATIAMVSLSSGEIRPLIEGGTRPVYSPTGHIVYARGGALYAVPFDSKSRTVTGDPFLLVDDLMTAAHTAAAHFALAANGTLVHASGGKVIPRFRMLRVGLDGGETEVGMPERYFTNVRVSPDRKRLATHIEGASSNVWVYDLERRTLDRVTGTWENEFPVWTPNGRELIYLSSRPRDAGIYRVAADGSGPTEPLWTESPVAIPTSVSSDNRLVFAVFTKDAGFDIWSLDLDDPSDAASLLAEPENETEPMISPDDRWLAYVSEASGQREVYLTTFPEAGGRWLISNAGGSNPIWSLDGRTLYYRQGTEMMAVSLQAGAEPRPGVPRRLFTVPTRPWLPMASQWDLAPDGRGFLVMEEVVRPAPTVLHVSTNLLR